MSEQDKLDELGDDLAHPIRQVDVFDTVLPLEGGGAYIGIVIATPLDASSRSIARLRSKTKLYLDSFFSTYGKNSWGTPKEGKMRIYVNMHPDSSPVAIQELESFRDAAHKLGVDVLIEQSLGGPAGDR